MRRDYRNAENVRLPGATTPIGLLDKPALIHWAFQQGQAYERGEISGLYDKRDKAADAGTHAHLMIEHHLRKLPEPPTTGMEPDVLDRAEKCYQTFLDWQERYGVEVLATEAQLVSEQYQYGGTLDIVTTKPEILDLKTSKGIYGSYWLQVAAYRQLWNENHPDNPVLGCHILRVGPDGDFGHEYREDLDLYFEIFTHCLSIYWLKTKGKVKL